MHKCSEVIKLSLFSVMTCLEKLPALHHYQQTDEKLCSAIGVAIIKMS